MLKALFSKIDLSKQDHPLAKSYYSSIKDIIELEEFYELKDYYQHFSYTRFNHCVNVSYYCYLICKKLGWNANSVARAGLVHDFYLYNWKDEQPIQGRHCNVHPKVALEMAKKYMEVDYVMEDAILNHMWPMSFHMPKTKEAWILQGVDKYCALCEILYQSSKKARFSALATTLFLLSIHVSI